MHVLMPVLQNIPVILLMHAVSLQQSLPQDFIDALLKKWMAAT